MGCLTFINNCYYIYGQKRPVLNKTKENKNKATSLEGIIYASNSFLLKGSQLYRYLPGYGTLTQPRVVPANDTTKHIIESQ